MNPALLSRELRRIATAINNSDNPSRKLVYQDIKRLIHRLSADEGSRSTQSAITELKKEIKSAGLASKIGPILKDFHNELQFLTKDQILEALMGLAEEFSNSTTVDAEGDYHSGKSKPGRKVNPEGDYT
jgi:hypothetical protein